MIVPRTHITEALSQARAQAPGISAHEAQAQVAQALCLPVEAVEQIDNEQTEAQ